MHDRRTVRNETHMVSFFVDGTITQKNRNRARCFESKLGLLLVLSRVGVVIVCNTSFVPLAIASMSLSRDCEKKTLALPQS